MKILLTMLCLTITAAAQTDKLVFWKIGNKCSASPKVAVVPADNFGCDSFLADGESVQVITLRGLEIAASFSDNGAYVVADLLIRNKSGQRVLFDPKFAFEFLHVDQATADVLNKKESQAIPAEKIASKLEGRIRWANAINAAGASMSTQQATLTTNTGQSATVTAPDTAAQSRAERTNAARSLAVATKVNSMMSSALRLNLLADALY